MHSNDTSVSRVENERQLLQFFCAGEEDLASRRAVFQKLRQYSWCDNDHRILFEAIGDLLERNPQRILEHLPAELTRRGFPDISCGALVATFSLNLKAALALAEKLARASQ